MLLVHDCRDNDAAARQAAALDDPTHSADHRRHTALHVLRAAAVEAAVADLGIEGPMHPADSDGVSVPAQHQRTARGSSLEHADDIRSARHDIGHLHAETDNPELAGNPPRHVGLTSRTRGERWIDRVDRDEVTQQRHRRVAESCHMWTAMRLVA